MVVPNGYCATRDQGATYYWPADRSTGSTWRYPDVLDPVELLDIWADLTVITLRRFGLSAEGESLTVDRVGLLSSYVDDNSGVVRTPWPVPMAQALFRARVSCKEPYKGVNTACLVWPAERSADSSFRAAPEASPAQASIVASASPEVLAQAEANVDDVLYDLQLMPRSLDNPSLLYPGGATVMYMDMEKAFSHLRDDRGHDLAVPDRGIRQGSSLDPTQSISSISKPAPPECLACTLDSLSTSWASWDCARRVESTDYEFHSDSKLFRFKATCASCGQISWSKFGYGSTPYLELVSNGWHKGKNNWKKTWCPECCSRYYVGPQIPAVSHSGIWAW